MPRLPEPSDLGGIPSARPGGRIATFDTTALGRGIAEFGAQMAAVGAKLNSGWEQVNALAVETEFQKFSFEETKLYNERVRNMLPGQAAGFSQGYLNEYKQRADQFSDRLLAKLPPAQRSGYDLKLFNLQRGFFSDAVEFEYQEQYRSANASLDDALNTAILPRAEMAAKLPANDPRKRQLADDAIRDAEKMIDANPAYTPIQKEEEKRKRRAAIQTQFLQALPPEERVTVDPAYQSQAPSALADRIVHIESRGRANAKNLLSSATGAGQFIDTTWLDMIRRNRPDLAEGRTRTQILALAQKGVRHFLLDLPRSEERRVGKECRSRWSPYH